MSAPEPMARFYGGVRAVARFWLWFFFKAVDVRHPERVPAEGPVLLCINHPNNFIDSLVVGAAVRRTVHYLATAALFRNPLVARFLLAAGAIPVWRKQDERKQDERKQASTRPISNRPPSTRSEHAAQDTTDRNADTFAACAAAFEHGALIAIYPEGTTHAEARVQRIKTGAARIALAWEAAHARTLTVVPVGLTFEARKSFRARVLVSFGEALPLLAEYHLRDETVHGRLVRLPARRRLVYSWQAVVGFPFFLYGTLVNLLPYLVPRWLAQRMARKETDYATVRLLASIVAFPVFYGLETWLVLRAAGGLAAALFALSLPLSGLIAYRYLAGAGRVRRRLPVALPTATA